MIDRNDLDLRISTHRARTAMINAHAWQQQRQHHASLLRIGLARMFVALAGRLAPARLAEMSIGSARREEPTAM